MDVRETDILGPLQIPMYLEECLIPVNSCKKVTKATWIEIFKKPTVRIRDLENLNLI